MADQHRSRSPPHPGTSIFPGDIACIAVGTDIFPGDIACIAVGTNTFPGDIVCIAVGTSIFPGDIARVGARNANFRLYDDVSRLGAELPVPFNPFTHALQGPEWTTDHRLPVGWVQDWQYRWATPAPVAFIHGVPGGFWYCLACCPGSPPWGPHHQRCAAWAG